MGDFQGVPLDGIVRNVSTVEIAYLFFFLL
jgi:hypothetical protein